MKLEAFLGKSLDEVKNYIKRTDFSEEDLKSFPPEIDIPISEAILKDGQFEIFNVLSDVHKIQFSKEKVVSIDIAVSEDKLQTIVNAMRSEFSDTFRFYTIEDFEKTKWIPMEKAENAFLEIKTKQLYFDNTKIFNSEDLEIYQTISCTYHGFNFLINLSKSFVIEDQKFYLTEIW